MRSVLVLNPVVVGDTLTGNIHLDSLSSLLIDSSYQREEMNRKSRLSIRRGIEAGSRLPPIDIGMRGRRYRIGPLPDSIELRDPCYIVDGQQRVATVREYHEAYPDRPVKLAATIDFDSAVDKERRRFITLNLTPKHVVPSIILRDSKEDCAVLTTMYGLTQIQNGVLQGRVCWQQNMTRGQLLTALNYIQPSMTVHAHLGGGFVSARGVGAIVKAGDKLEAAIGLPIVRSNVTTFWELIDTVWGIRNIQYKQGYPWLRGTFLRVLAQILSDHTDFWAEPNGMRLVIPADIRRRLVKFPVTDPEVTRLAGSGGKAAETLYYMIVSHLNAGRQQHKRLKHRLAVTPAAAKPKLEMAYGTRGAA